MKSLMAQDATPFENGEKKVSDLMEPGAIISDNGDVTATLKQVDSWTEYSASGPNSGYFFPTQIDVPDAKKMKLYKTTSESEDYGAESKDVDYDNTIVARVADDDGAQQIYDLKIVTYADQEEQKPLTTTELHFNGISYKSTDGE